MAKELVITGVAQETDFSDPENTNTLLVINNGALRLPLNGDHLQKLLEHALGVADEKEPEEQVSSAAEKQEQDDDDENDDSDEAGIPQI